MPDFSLHIAFTNEQLETIFTTGTNVVVAKPLDGNNPNVAWEVFKPFQNNTIEWDEEYGIYASTAAITNASELYPSYSKSPIPSAMSKLYSLEDSGAISGPASGGTLNSYSLLNQYSGKDYMTVGLYQNASVNGTTVLGNAISATSVILQSKAVMTPHSTVYIWLQSHVVSNTVVTTVTSPMTKLLLSESKNSASVTYDSASGHFLPQ